jgi:hypothetical protein
MVLLLIDSSVLPSSLGAMTWALFDKLNGNWKRFVGVDISPKSVELYNQKAATQFTPEEMHAVCTELHDQPDQLGGQKFDLVVVRRLPLSFTLPFLISLLCLVLLRLHSAPMPTTTLQT